MITTGATPLEVTWGRTMKIWWSYIWRRTLFSALLGLGLGFLGGLTVGLLGRPDLGGAVGFVLGNLGAIPVSFIVLRNILRRRFGTFSIALIPDQVH
jgi:hypothetical protein